jgi:hypothetical protein
VDFGDDGDDDARSKATVSAGGSSDKSPPFSANGRKYLFRL